MAAPPAGRRSLNVRSVRAAYRHESLRDARERGPSERKTRHPSIMDYTALATLDLESLEKLSAAATIRRMDRKRKSLHSMTKETMQKLRRQSFSNARRPAPRHVATIFAPVADDGNYGGDGTEQQRAAASPEYALCWRSAVSKDPVMQQKLDYELRMRDGAAKLLSAAASAKYSTAQCLDAAKTLIVSSMRMATYVDLLQQQLGKRPASRSSSVAAAENVPTTSAVIAQPGSLSDGSQLPSKATVALSEIRIPLMWKDTDHFKNKGTHRRFAIFCVSQIGTAVQETSLIVPVDRTVTDVSFDDCLVMEDASHDFRCKLSVYAHELCDDMTIASAPVKLRKKINSISSSIGRRLSGTGLKENVEDTAVSGPRFDVVAHAELSLKDCKDNTGIHDLVVNGDSDIASGLPLFGNFSCRIIAQPHSLTKEAAATYLLVKESSEQWLKYWCVLRNLRISCWGSPFEADLQDPVLTIPVTKDSLVVDADPFSAEKPFMFHIRSVSRAFSDHDLAAESADVLKQWWAALERHLLDQVVWNHACENLLEIKTPPAPRRNLSTRNGVSLYEKMPAKGVGVGCKAAAAAEHEASPLTLMFNRLTREDSCPKSPALTRKSSRH